MWKLRIETDRGQLDWAPLDAPVVTLGRAEGCEVRLRERNVSRRHASLRRTPEGRWVLVDHDSYNGSFLNGRRLAGESPLSPRDLVQIGDYFLSLDAGEGADVGTTMSGGAASAPPSTAHRLFAADGAPGGPDFDLSKGPLTIGSFDDCKVRISGPAVAGVRVRLRPLAGERYEIIDESERPSMLVNGVELRRKVLEGGDLVELGDALMLGLDARLAYALRYAGRVRAATGPQPDGGAAPWALGVRPAAGDRRKRARVSRGVRPPSERVEEAHATLRAADPGGGERRPAERLRALVDGALAVGSSPKLRAIGDEALAVGFELSRRASRAGRLTRLVVGAFVGGVLVSLALALARGPRPSPAKASDARGHDVPARAPSPPPPLPSAAPDASAPAAPPAPALEPAR